MKISLLLKQIKIKIAIEKWSCVIVHVASLLQQLDYHHNLKTMIMLFMPIALTITNGPLFITMIHHCKGKQGLWEVREKHCVTTLMIVATVVDATRRSASNNACKVCDGGSKSNEHDGGFMVVHAMHNGGVQWYHNGCPS